VLFVMADETDQDPYFVWPEKKIVQSSAVTKKYRVNYTLIFARSYTLCLLNDLLIVGIEIEIVGFFFLLCYFFFFRNFDVT
jgi:hypothetical protein